MAFTWRNQQQQLKQQHVFHSPAGILVPFSDFGRHHSGAQRPWLDECTEPRQARRHDSPGGRRVPRQLQGARRRHCWKAHSDDGHAEGDPLLDVVRLPPGGRQSLDAERFHHSQQQEGPSAGRLQPQHTGRPGGGAHQRRGRPLSKGLLGQFAHKLAHSPHWPQVAWFR